MKKLYIAAKLYIKRILNRFKSLFNIPKNLYYINGKYYLIDKLTFKQFENLVLEYNDLFSGDIQKLIKNKQFEDFGQTIKNIKNVIPFIVVDKNGDLLNTTQRKVLKKSLDHEDIETIYEMYRSFFFSNRKIIMNIKNTLKSLTTNMEDRIIELLIRAVDKLKDYNEKTSIE